jgi:hypothetical protein
MIHFIIFYFQDKCYVTAIFTTHANVKISSFQKVLKNFRQHIRKKIFR